MKREERIIFSSQTDEVLMVLYQKGEYQAFEELYTRHSGRVYGYLRRRVSNANELSDLVQQVFLRLHQSRSRYDSNFPFLPWLFSIVRNLQIDFMRKHKETAVDVDRLQLVDDSKDSDVFEQKEESAILNDSIKGLTPAQRDLINLRFQQGLSFEEISKRIGITSSTARKQVSRLIRTLRQTIRAKGTRS